MGRGWGSLATQEPHFPCTHRVSALGQPQEIFTSRGLDSRFAACHTSGGQELDPGGTGPHPLPRPRTALPAPSNSWSATGAWAVAPSSSPCLFHVTSPCFCVLKRPLLIRTVTCNQGHPNSLDSTWSSAKTPLPKEAPLTGMGLRAALSSGGHNPTRDTMVSVGYAPPVRWAS